MKYWIIEEEDQWLVKEGDNPEPLAIYPTEAEALLDIANRYAKMAKMAAEKEASPAPEPAPVPEPTPPEEPMALKAGARNSAADAANIQKMHDTSVELGAACGQGGVLKGENIELEDIPMIVGSVKALGERIIEIKIPFGSPSDKDGHGDYFTPQTDFAEEVFPKTPITFYHGSDSKGRFDNAEPSIIGESISAENRTDGRYYKAKLNNSELANQVWAAAQKGEKLWASPGTMPNFRRPATKAGEIKYWPMVDLAVWPSSLGYLPANRKAVAVSFVKAFYGEDIMPTEIESLKAELSSVKQLLTRQNRPPEAPAVLQFAETAEFDHLETADLAFVTQLSLACKSKLQSADLFRRSAKALALRLIGNEHGICREDREHALKSLAGRYGIERHALTSLKANELNYSTQAGYGDEFASIAWDKILWDRVRETSDIVGMLPSKTIPQGAESLTIPVEVSDPTWYFVGQTTGTGTNGRPDATVISSKAGTSNKTLAPKKFAARVTYTEELREDSIIEWAGFLRDLFTKSFAEQLATTIVDGDTATGATTNINHIGGTPGDKDLYLAFDGFRKLGLVTNTANSYNASGGYTDTMIVELAKLMGTAGLYALDPSKIGLIMDGNTYYSSFSLDALKTRDVNSMASIENGRVTSMFGYKIVGTTFIHGASATRKANTAGKVDQTTPANNTTGAIVMVRWDQWLLGRKRGLTMKTQEFIDSDSTDIVATARVALNYRDTDASAVLYNIGL